MANMGSDDDVNTTTQLDSHANMVVVGRQATVFGSTGKCADVRPFSNDCSKLEAVPIVDAAVAYDCPYTMQTYILTVRNALHVSSMPHNLVPPFIMREAGLVVNDVPRIHTDVKDLTDETHCIVSKEGEGGAELKIPMTLDGIFSCFPTRKLTKDEIEACEYIPNVALCPDSETWDPYDPTFSNQEESMIDYKGNVIVQEQKRRKLLDDREVSHINVSVERYEAAISSIVARNHEDPSDSCASEACNPQEGYEDFIRDDDVLKAAVAEMSVCYDDDLFCKAVTERVKHSKIAMEAGDVRLEDITSDVDVCQIFATQAEKPKGVSPEHLSKVWRITHDDAKRTIGVTTQLGRRSMDASLARRFGTNDRMLRYRRINSVFFTDTFFTKVKSKRGYTMM